MTEKDMKQIVEFLCCIEEKKREERRKRQREGIEAARLRGVQFGRPRKPVPSSFGELKGAWEKGEISSRNAAKQLGISQETFLRWVYGK